MALQDTRLQRRGYQIQLTARSAGVLEVSNRHGTSAMALDSSIQYFHRTAKDFLESEEIWAKLSLATAKTNSNPNIAMMRSCLMNIRLRIAFAAESAQRCIGYELDAST